MLSRDIWKELCFWYTIICKDKQEGKSISHFFAKVGQLSHFNNMDERQQSYIIARDEPLEE